VTWSTNDGVASTINLSHSSGASTIFILKRLLKNEGWTVLASGDGISAYSSSSDIITSAGSGANGMDNSNAWFRIEDPLSAREYVFQRGTAGHYSWKWIYSASDGFTGGSPDYQTLPTATDQQGLAKNSTAFQTMFPTSGSWRIHMAAEDAAHNGVYAWWCCGYWSSAEQLLMCCDALDSATTASDNDPCVHYGSDVTGTLAVLSDITSTGTDTFKGWLRYNETDEEWGGLSAAYLTLDSYVLMPTPSGEGVVIDPHDGISGSDVLASIWLARLNSTLNGYKGALKNIRWVSDSNSRVYTDLIQTEGYLLVWKLLALPGWPDTTTPLT